MLFHTAQLPGLLWLWLLKPSSFCQSHNSDSGWALWELLPGKWGPALKHFKWLSKRRSAFWPRRELCGQDYYTPPHCSCVHHIALTPSSQASVISFIQIRNLLVSEEKHPYFRAQWGVHAVCILAGLQQWCASYSQVRQAGRGGGGGVFFIKPIQKINFFPLKFQTEAFIHNQNTWFYNLHLNFEDFKKIINLRKSHWRIPYGSPEHKCPLLKPEVCVCLPDSSVYHHFINNPLKCHFFSLEVQDL